MSYFFTFFFLLNFCLGQKPAENLVIITIDGVRWQEIFKGIDNSIVLNSLQINEIDTLFKHYNKATVEEKRHVLMPFFWDSIATKGQIYGNRDYGSKVKVGNLYKISYPGYNEMFCGFTDITLNTNKLRYNKNRSILEYLYNYKYQNNIAVFSSWRAMPYILNTKRSKIPTFSAFSTTDNLLNYKSAKLSKYFEKTPNKRFYLKTCADTITNLRALTYLKQYHPKITYISFGETDEWGHSGNYVNYINAIHNFDGYLKQLWNFLQNDSIYKNNTTLFITTDHGRGSKKPSSWKNHGIRIKGSKQIWFAVLSNNIKPKGEIKRRHSYKAKRFAKTFALALGIKKTFSYRMARPITQIFK